MMRVVGDGGRERVKTKCLRVARWSGFLPKFTSERNQGFSIPSGLQAQGDYH